MRGDANTHAQRNAAQIALLLGETDTAQRDRVIHLLTHVLRAAKTKHLALLLDETLDATSELLADMEKRHLIMLGADGRWVSA
ncbi:hypothetical protein E7T09_04260 [Deinococcus sp. KSM4-11]|uniref:hypothetical protein n=1 Tax=Deinococcus sp. KSM4-11 TaxID=2568654 RepID=UPI0010A40EE1|nr:hypothetical protein [Deinococcus sp. KSM4-11]THF88427.1 hypothetical protein E7T09_04260 [Deinococcus sp. KSM4-11]